MRLPHFISSYRFFLLLALILLTAFLRVIDDPDIWFHLSFGREILSNGIPDQEFLVFTRFGEPADYNSWGFGSLYFLIWSLSGFTGMALATVLGVIFTPALFRTVQGLSEKLRGEKDAPAPPSAAEPPSGD